MGRFNLLDSLKKASENIQEIVEKAAGDAVDGLVKADKTIKLLKGEVGDIKKTVDSVLDADAIQKKLKDHDAVLIANAGVELAKKIKIVAKELQARGMELKDEIEEEVKDKIEEVKAEVEEIKNVGKEVEELVKPKAKAFKKKSK